MRTRYFITAAAACLLAACSGAQNSQAPTSSEVPATSEVTSPQAVEPQPAPPATRPPEKAASAPVRETVRATPEPVPPPETLIGMAPNAVDERLGAPDLVRLDGPAEIRLYRNAETSCTFHVFLYVDNAAALTKSVEHYEARNQSGRLEGAGLADCYRALVRPGAIS